MDAFVALLPPRPRAVVEIICELVLIATSILLVVFAWPVVSMLAELDQRSEAADIPLVLPQGMMPLGFLFMGLLIAIRLLVRGVAPADPIASRSDH
jgi:TRAP-type C4-dicarboxylate transport system permease small subunit